MNGYQKRTNQKREAILKSARQLFQTYGFKKVSLNEIAATAGVSPVTIYNQFRTKESLGYNIFSPILQQFDSTFFEILGNSEKTREKLKQILLFQKQAFPERDRQLMHSVQQHVPALEEHAAEVLGRTSRAFQQFLSAGQQRGDIRDDISLEVLHFFLMQFVDGPDMERNQAEYLELFLSAVLRENR
ncbi:MAG TPA: TetR/AcrR family transcriptional regulator [Thermotogota bacterium]|mgnify:CR=1 FL=1|nr:TetR/AcrR family transcriptional regulator [Thermotogota bacterium]HRW92099.1 TetR/AcrR family transcriptional regulator [Thermotogota bacterium]